MRLKPSGRRCLPEPARSESQPAGMPERALRCPLPEIRPVSPPIPTIYVLTSTTSVAPTRPLVEPQLIAAIHTIMTKTACFSVLLFLLAGCATSPIAAPEVASDPPTFPPPPPCPITSSTDWKAWVDARGWPDRAARLHVTGRVTLPWIGWRLYWKGKQVLQSTPVHVYVSLDAAPPSAGGSEPDVEIASGNWPSEAVVGSVTIICRDRQLARIATVQTVR